MESSSGATYLTKGIRQLLEVVQRPERTAAQGLDGVVCGKTELIGFADDRVQYCGEDIEQLCDRGSFEEVMWLLLNRCSADPDELADLHALLDESAVIDGPIAETIAAVPLQIRPLDLFPLAVSLLSCFDPTPDDRTLAGSTSQFWRVMAQLPVLLHVAFGGRLEDGRIAVGDEGEALSWAGRLLQVLRDDNEAPSPIEEHAMNVVMTCQCLTELRPACFLARFCGSAVNDVVAGLKAASSVYVSQLRNDPFAWTSARMKQFKSPDEAESWWHARQPKTMPFGFRPETEDLRATLLRQQGRELLGSVPAMVLEACAARLEHLQARQGQFPTTDWAAARVLTLLNVPEDRISLAIGIARLVGWAAHTIEQHTSGIPLLPSLRYAEEQEFC
ncbi:MAG: citrate/2-methylcitrate synthase [Planctomycetaceae bacterium]